MKHTKRNLDNLGAQNVFKKQTCSRKTKRKNLMKRKKINKAINYAQSKQTDKVCINPNDVNMLKNSTDLYSSTLSDKILSNTSTEFKDNTNISKKKSRRKKKNTKAAPENYSIDNDGSTNSFRMSSNSNLRLARLQEYVNDESNKLRTAKIQAGIEKEKSNKPNNLIKDKKKLEDLKLGQETDIKEINRYARKLKLRAAQRKQIYPVFIDDFGEILEDIEGDSFNWSKYETNKLDYNSDENFENDMLSALGKKVVSERKKESQNKFMADEDDDEETDEGVEMEDEESEREAEKEEEEVRQEEEEEEEEKNDSEMEDCRNENSFLDDEAEEDIEFAEESEGEIEDSPEELVFESGSTLISKQNSTKSPQVTFNSLFDYYSSDSEEDGDLEDFVVDDNFVEYETDDDAEIESFPKNKKKSRIIGRAVRDSISEAEPMPEELTSPDVIIRKGKRRRILSEESEADSPTKTRHTETIFGVDHSDDNLEEKNNNKKPSLDANKNFKSGKLRFLEENHIKKKKNTLGKDSIEVCLDEDEDQLDKDWKSILKAESKEQKHINETKLTNGTNNELVKQKKHVSFTISEKEEEKEYKKEETEIEETKIQNWTEEYHEDIYGRLRDSDGKLVPGDKDKQTKCKYIPPAMRKLMALNNDEKKKEQLAALQRRLKGLFNRVAESNMKGIISQFEAFYQTNSRNDMNDTLTKLLFEMLVTPVLSQERLAQEYALLVAVLSANVGPEIGAHILTEFVLKWVEQFEDFQPLANANKIDSKEVDNMLLFISQLYNFKVMDATLIYDILYKILEQPLKAKEIDLILLVLRNVGFTLRKDNPLELKRFITQIQSQTEGGAPQADECYTRVKFMLEVLTAIRNNNMAKVPNFDPAHSQHLKSLIKGLVRKGCRTSDLKISLSDLVKSKVVGKWWVVGSAWSGGLKEDMDWSGAEGPAPKDVAPVARVPAAAAAAAAAKDYSASFRKKAAALHMARPPRVHILYALTEGSRDYDDAFEHLLQLKLQSNQEQEIFNVMLYCCLRCKEHKPFYVQLAMKLCKFRKSFKRLLQFCIWDKFKQLDRMKAPHAANLAKFVAPLISEDCLNLSLVKTLNFAEADGKTVSFLRQTLIAILVHPTGAYAVSRAFDRLCSSPELKGMRQYIRLFILKFISPKKCEDKEMKVLESRVKLALEILTSAGGVKL